MKKIFFTAALFYSMSVFSQITTVDIQASGLTCSMCSNAINKALKSLDFVHKVEANIKNSSFEITFKDHGNVDFEKLKKKVEDAGFSVASFSATMLFNNVMIKSGEEISVGDKKFHFINMKDQLLNGLKTITVIDKGFVSSKEYKKYPVTVSNGLKIYHVIMKG